MYEKGKRKAMKKKKTQLLGIVLSAAMLATSVPMPAYAEPTDNVAENETNDATAVQETTDEADAVADDAAVDEADDSTVADDATPEEADEQETADEADDQAAEEESKEATTDEDIQISSFKFDASGIKFNGANAAVADNLVKDQDIEIDENDPAIAQLRKELEEIEVVGGEAGEEDEVSTVALYDAEESEDTTDTTDTTEKKQLTDEQIQTVLVMYSQYQQYWKEHADVLGVQMPFYLQYNDDDKDGLGVLGEMLILAGKTVKDVRDGNYSYDDLTGMIMNFRYGDQYGVGYYGPKVKEARNKGLEAVEKSGATTEAQKLLALNDYLAQIDTFDMAYIMNSSDTSSKTMRAPDEDGAKNEHWGEMYKAVYDNYEDSIRQNFHDQIYAGVVAQLRQQFYENAIKQGVHDQVYNEQLKSAADPENPTEDEKAAAEEAANAAADQYMTENKDAIAKDAAGFVTEKFGAETADQIATQADAFIKDAEKNGVAGVDSSNPEQKYTVEQITQSSMATDKIADLDQDGVNEATANEAIPAYAQQAATQLTDGIVNYWEGTQFGAMALGKSVCLGYSKAYAYMIQCMHPEIYLKEGTSDIENWENWKTTKDLYYIEDADGNLTFNIDKRQDDNDYLVDLVRITFDTDVTMYGTVNSGFNSDHFWNAVKVDGKWYYIDPCYTDVYTEVMSRNRGEINGSMNHMYFMFSHTTTLKLYKNGDKNYYSELKSSYADKATDTSYEKSWMNFIRSNTSFDKKGNAYYSYDSSDMIGMQTSDDPDYTSMMNTQYKIVQHNMSNADTSTSKNGTSTDFTTLIYVNKTDQENNMNSQASIDDYYAQVYNPETNKLEKNDELTKIVRQYLNESSIYPSIFTTSAYYNGKVYFNISNDIFTYDLKTGKVTLVKEYNEVTGHRDKTEAFGAMAFSTSGKETEYDISVNNAPIAGFVIKDDKMYVSIATNYAWVSGRTEHNVYLSEKDENGQYPMDEEVKKTYGYEFQESNYNKSYSNYKSSMNYNSDDNNDNDEFMWTACITDVVDMAKLDATDESSHQHHYDDAESKVTVAPFCGKDGYTEIRCTDKDCGKIKEGSREVQEGTAVDHHYVHYKEIYYTKADNSNDWNEGESYVCVDCGYAVESDDTGDTLNSEESVVGANDTWELAKKKAGHTYAPDNADDVTWNDDNTATIAKGAALTCTDCASKSLDCLQSYTEEGKKIQTTAAEDITLDVTTSHEGTCDKGVTYNYTATGKQDNNTIQATKSVPQPAGQHAYENVEFNWDAAAIKDEDGNITGYKTEQKEGSAVTVGELKCKVCEKVEENATVSVVKDTEASKAPTCEEAGKDVYVATVKDANDVTIAEDTKEVTLQALGHKWKSDATFDWKPGDNNTYTATATFTCERNAEHTETVDATVVEAPEGATCTTAGKITYTATAEYEGVKAEDSKTKDVPALGHNWSTPKLTWSETEGDAPTVTGVVTCERCKEEETVEVTVAKTKTEDPTCETKGANVYTATTKDPNGKEYTEEHSYEIPALGHEWNAAPVWNWSDDNETATATFTCERNNEHTQDVKAEVTKEDTVKATCEEEGTVTYTATVTGPDGQTYTDQRTKNVPATGHDWNEATWSWTENASGGFDATVTITCKNNMKHGKTETVTATKTEVKEATCGEAGSETYKAETTDMDGNVISDTHVKPLPKTGNHTYGDWVVTKKATAVETGVKEKTCTVCGKVKTGTVKKLTPKGKLNMEIIYLQVDQSTTAWEVVGMQRGDSVASYKVKSKKVATVTKDGKIVAKKKGTTKFVVTLASGKVIETTLKVQSGKVRTTKLAVSKTSVTLKVGKRSTIETTLTPLTSQESLSYKTSNKKVAAVTREGKIVAKGKGKATVTVTSGSQSVKINVTVK